MKEKKKRGFQAKLVKGERKNVYLDLETLDKAKKIGANVSEGLRIAVKEHVIK